MKRLILLGVIGSQVIGCTGLVGQSLFTGEGEGRFLLSTDAEGMRAFNDGLNGLVTTGKASPDTQDAYWRERENQTKTGGQVKVLRFKAMKGGSNE